MVVVKWSDNVKGLVDNVDNLLCMIVYMEEEEYLFPCSGTDPDANIN